MVYGLSAEARQGLGEQKTPGREFVPPLAVHKTLLSLVRRSGGRDRSEEGDEGVRMAPFFK